MEVVARASPSFTEESAQRDDECFRQAGVRVTVAVAVGAMGAPVGVKHPGTRQAGHVAVLFVSAPAPLLARSSSLPLNYLAACGAMQGPPIRFPLHSSYNL